MSDLENQGMAGFTPVLTGARGWVTAETLRPGDTVPNREGKWVEVRAASVSRAAPLIAVSTAYGATLVQSPEYPVLTVSKKRARSRGRTVWIDSERVDTTSWVASETGGLDHLKNQGGIRFREHAPVLLPRRELPVDPYVFGYWAGDGFSKIGSLCAGSEDAWWIARIAGREPRFDDSGVAVVTVPGLTTKLRHVGVLGDKHIPPQFVYASPGQRLELVRGMCDSDGHCNISGAQGGSAEFGNTNSSLVSALCAVLSLDGVGYNKRIFYPTSKNGDVHRHAWKVRFRHRETPFKLPRKADPYSPPGLLKFPNSRFRIRYGKGVGVGEVVRVSVDGGEFLATKSLIPVYGGSLS